VLVTSGATATWGGGSLSLGGTSEIDNAGDFTISADGAVNAGTSALISNTGKIVLDPGPAHVVSLGAPFDNSGSVTVESGTTDVSGGGSTSGSTTVADGALAGVRRRDEHHGRHVEHDRLR